MANEVIGKIHAILQSQSGAGKNGQWIKQDFVIETIEQYPKKVCFEAWNDKTSILKSLKPGTQVNVAFNPESREFNGKWYTSLRVWKIDVTGGSQESGSAPAYDMPPMPDAPPPMPDGDLPF